MSTLASLRELVRPRLSPPAQEWFDAAVALGPSFDAAAFRSRWSAVGRRVPCHAIVPRADEATRLRERGPWPVAGWSLDDGVRATLLLSALDLAPTETHSPLLHGLYAHGTIRERQSLLRALAWLPDPARFVPVAEEAGRSHVPAVLEALAIANPFPARHLPGPAFDSLVLRALAFRLPPTRIVGLAERVAAERDASGTLPGRLPTEMLAIGP